MHRGAIDPLAAVPKRKPMLASSTGVQFGNLDPSSIAEQITVLDCKFLEVVQPNEFLGQSWTKQDKDTKAPRLAAYLEWLMKVLSTKSSLIFIDA
jgi:hypothetical protein